MKPYVLPLVLGACGGGAVAPATTPPTGPSSISVPAGTAPAIDGVVAPEEWAAAHVIDLDAGAKLHLIHDDRNLYLAVSGVPAKRFGLACVFIADAARVHVLHASAKIGSALYAPAGARLDPQSKQYAWKDADTLMREEQWVASISGDGSSREFGIALAKLALAPGAVSAPIAIGYLYREKEEDEDMSGILTWPAGIGDAVANKQVLGGWNPEQMQFAHERWARLSLAKG
jgi:hypothetical protein